MKFEQILKNSELFWLHEQNIVNFVLREILLLITRHQTFLLSRPSHTAPVLLEWKKEKCSVFKNELNVVIRQIPHFWGQSYECGRLTNLKTLCDTKKTSRILWFCRNIDEVVRFPGTRTQKQQLTYAAKQLIAREVTQLNANTAINVSCVWWCKNRLH